MEWIFLISEARLSLREAFVWNRSELNVSKNTSTCGKETNSGIMLADASLRSDAVYVFKMTPKCRWFMDAEER